MISLLIHRSAGDQPLPARKSGAELVVYIPAYYGLRWVPGYASYTAPGQWSWGPVLRVGSRLWTLDQTGHRDQLAANNGQLRAVSPLDNNPSAVQYPHRDPAHRTS